MWEMLLALQEVRNAIETASRSQALAIARKHEAQAQAEVDKHDAWCSRQEREMHGLQIEPEDFVQLPF